MAAKAAACGHELTGYTRRPRGDRTAAVLEAAGLKVSHDLAEATEAEIVSLCVFDDEQLRDVLLEKGVLAGLRPGTVVVIHTTASPVLVRSLAAAAPVGVAVLDANFSGTPQMATDGRLTLMTGGDPAALARARPVLESFACSITHVGGPGDGQTLKLINNALFAGQLRLASDALDLLRAEGLDPAAALDVLRVSSARSHALDVLAREADWHSQIATLRHWLDKDADVARAAAADLGLDLGLIGLSIEGYGLAFKEGD